MLAIDSIACCRLLASWKLVSRWLVFVSRLEFPPLSRSCRFLSLSCWDGGFFCGETHKRRSSIVWRNVKDFETLFGWLPRFAALRNYLCQFSRSPHFIDLQAERNSENCSFIIFFITKHARNLLRSSSDFLALYRVVSQLSRVKRSKDLLNGLSL